MKVESEAFSDRPLVGFGSSPGAVELRAPDGEVFGFTGYVFERVAGQSVVARG
jgi:hypothetical protein